MAKRIREKPDMIHRLVDRRKREKTDMIHSLVYWKTREKTGNVHALVEMYIHWCTYTVCTYTGYTLVIHTT